MQMRYAGQTLTLESRDGVAWLTFEQARTLNALSPLMAGEFLECCRLLRDSSDLRVLVMRGSGKAFMAGGDLQTLRQDPEGAVAAILVPMHEAVQILRALPLVVLARLHGAVAGAGLSLACLADLSIAEHGTRFVYAYADIASSCDLGLSWSLVQRLGSSRAMEIALLSEGFDAQQALDWGLVNRLAAADQLDALIEDWANRLAARPAHVLAATRTLMTQAQTGSLAEQLDLEHKLFLDCAKRPAFAEAIDRFFARRR